MILQFLVFISQLRITICHNDFTVITVPYYSVCFTTLLAQYCSQGTQVSILAKAETLLLFVEGVNVEYVDVGCKKLFLKIAKGKS